MSPSSHLSKVAIAAGLPARYLYWFGHSGRRYLFTCTGANAAADFEAGVAIAVSGGEIVWTGEVVALARMADDELPRRAEVYVHLLAETLAERRAVIEDLRPAERVRLRLAA
jgi:hypothetical protein